jgi:hypothetical protein
VFGHRKKRKKFVVFPAGAAPELKYTTGFLRGVSGDAPLKTCMISDLPSARV